MGHKPEPGLQRAVLRARHAGHQGGERLRAPGVRAEDIPARHRHDCAKGRDQVYR